MIKRAMVVCLIVTSFGLTLITNAQTCDDFETALDYYLYGEELYADGFLTDAIDAYNCALEIDPADLYAFNSRGLSYLYLDDYELALADFEAIIALDDTASYAWNNRALVHYYYGELDLALEGFTQAIDLGDDDLIPLENRALTYYYQAEYFSAETDLYSALEIDPTYKDAYLSLAWVYEGMNFGEQHGMFAEWIRLNTTETREVNLSGSVEDEVYDMAEGVVYRLNFSGSAGQTIRVSARANESADVDPLLVLLDGEGMAIASDDDSGVNLDAVISGFALPEDGDYTLLLTHGDSGETGAITVSLILVKKVALLLPIVLRHSTYLSTN